MGEPGVARVTEAVRPDNPAMSFGLPDFDFTSTDSLRGLDSEVVRQALMVSYTDSFWVLFITCLVDLRIPCDSALGSAYWTGAGLGLQNRWCSARAAARWVRFPCASAMLRDGNLGAFSRRSR